MVDGVIGLIGPVAPQAPVLLVRVIVFDLVIILHRRMGNYAQLQTLANIRALPCFSGQLCPGDAMETRVCYGVASCPVNGNWSPWGDWSTCSSTCVGGRRFRYRNCTNPPPSNGGISCVGSNVEVDGTCANSTCGKLYFYREKDHFQS